MKRGFGSNSLVGVMPFMAGLPLSTVFMMMAALGLMVYSSARPQVFEGVRAGVEDAFAPILGAVSYPFQKSAQIIENVSGLAQLQAENERLMQENEKLRQWYHTALLLESENKSLRALLDVKLDPEYQHVSARVIADAGSSFAKSLMVLAGRKDGVAKGQAVLSEGGLIGRVIEAGEDTSRILLVTDMNARVPITIEDTQQNAIMAGNNTFYPQLMHMPQDSEIGEGARVITSGHDGITPQGLPVGRVIVNKDGEKRVALFAKPQGVHFVRVIISPDNILKGN